MIQEMCCESVCDQYGLNRLCYGQLNRLPYHNTHAPKTAIAMAYCTAREDSDSEIAILKRSRVGESR